MNETGPTAAQREAVESNASRILVIAGPGSGKTRTMIWRMNRLLDEGIEPSNIVAITFTNAAAKEIAERLRKDAQEKGEVPRLGYVGTLHGYALRELQRHGSVLGYGSRLTVLDEEQADELLKRVAKDIGCKASWPKLKETRDAWKHGRRPSTAEEIAIASFYKRMRETDTIDFDTILRDFLALLQNASTPAGTCSHLFVDEFQDSGAVDVRIYNALFAGNRFFVGDPDQAIYGFRGGDVNGILALARDIGETHHFEGGATVARAGWHTIKLEGNFRCAPAICSAANRLIERNTARIPKRTLSMREADGTQTVKSIAGEVNVWPPAVSDTAEAERVVMRFAAEIADGAEPNELAILARTNAIAMDAARMCKTLGVPVREKKHARLPADWRRCRLTIDLFSNPNNSTVAEQWLRESGQREEIAKAALQAVPITHVIPKVFAMGEPVAKLPQHLARLQISAEAIELVEAKLADMVDPEFAQLAYALAAELDHVPEIGRGVTVTTMHAAKGREWGTVAIIGAEEEITPGRRKSDDPSRMIEEERRLFFVAVTRAKDVLLVSSAKHRREPWGNKRLAPASPSRFIAELKA